jgi:Mrp family chromosome partitioning ATPase
MRDWSKTVKLIGGSAFGGIAFGLAWAFLIELFFDRSIKRPRDVERMAKLPLFLSIPLLGRSERRRLHAAAAERLGLPGPSGDSPPAPANGAPQPDGAALAALDQVQLLHPFHETLRDRLIGYFESKGLTHKPKLVAVTGLGRNTGVTTTAAGLAGTLSETGDGNVLLVDMTVEQGSAQQFYKGKGVCGLEEVLDTRGHAQIQDNLFVVGEGPGGDRLSRMLPQRFNKLIPKLKASDFDYIIFDMPPVSQLSITPRLAGFMDMVLLVIESEKTDQELVQRATTLLAESNAHVGAVLNKTKAYVPARLYQENLGNT